MLTRISEGTIYDPINGIDGEVRDIYIENDRVVKRPSENTKVDQIIDAKELILMPGGIDIHTHIGGGKGNIARLIMTEDCRVSSTEMLRSGSGQVAPSTFITGYEYAS